jgi:hypothetical protein
MKTSFRTPVVATQIKLKGRSEHLVGNNGEINAGSNKELIQTVARLMELAKTQDIHTESEARQRMEIARVQGEMMRASFNDAQVHRELGEIMADDLYLAGNRDGFARRFMIKQELQQGQVPRVKMRMKNVTAVVASGPSKVETQITQDEVFWAPEFDLITRPFVTKREIDQSVSDVVDEKYVEGLEGIMVKEDLVWKGLADQTVGMDNPLTNIAGNLTPAGLMVVKNYVTSYNIPARYLLLANDLWNDIVADSTWIAAIDQVSKHEVLLTGQLGTVYGMDIISDAFRHPQHKVLNKGEFYVIGNAENHGAMTDRGGVESTPTDISTERMAGRGWILVSTTSPGTPPTMASNQMTVCARLGAAVDRGKGRSRVQRA